MPPVTQVIILFAGLITHVQQPAVNGVPDRVVFVRAPHHRVRLWVETKSIDATVTPTFDVDTAISDDDYTVFKLDAEHVQMRGVALNEPIIKSADFDDRVPPLTKITDGENPLPEIKEAKTTFRARGYFDLEGGQLFPYDLLGDKPHPVTFPGSNYPGTHLLADAIVYGANNTGPVELVSDSGKRIRLAQDALIAVINGPPHRLDEKATAQQASPPEEFSEYLWLVDGNNISLPEHEAEGPFASGRLTTSSLTPLRTFIDEHIARLNIPLRVECSNTQYP